MNLFAVFLRILILTGSLHATDIPISIGPPQSGGNSPVNPLASQYIPAFNYSGPSWVYTHDISTKVFQNATTQGSLQTIKMAGVRNEVIGYQVFIKAPSQLQNVVVTMTLPTHTQYSTTLSSDTNVAAGNFRILVSSYVAIDTMTATGAHGDYYGVSHALIPDPLIPSTWDPYYHQLTNVMPMTIQSGNTQGFWIEGFLPTGIASGYYSFNVLVSSGATPATRTTIATIPAAVEVFDSTMSIVPAFGMVNAQGYGAMGIQAYGAGNTNWTPYRPDICGTNGDCDANVMAHDIAVYYLDHKMTISGSNPGGQTAANTTAFLGTLVDGTVSATYLNPILLGTHFTTLQAQFAGSSNSTCQQFVNVYGSSTTVFNYICDEPGVPPGGGWPTCQTNLTGVSACNGNNLITSTFANFNTQGDTGTVNMMSPLGENLHGDGGSYTAWLAALSSNIPGGPKNFLGSYWDCISSNGYCIAGFTGTGTGHPNPHIDGRPINQQAMPISIGRSSGTFILNSAIDQCWTDNIDANINGGCGTSHRSIKNGMLDFGEGGTGAMLYAGQGDETWGYPGTSTWLGVNVSTPIYIGSIRIEEWTAGIQYMDYRTLLKNGSNDGYWWQQLATWMTDDENFNNDPDNNGSFTGTITSARSNMGCKIHQQKWPGAACGW